MIVISNDRVSADDEKVMEFKDGGCKPHLEMFMKFLRNRKLVFKEIEKGVWK